EAGQQRIEVLVTRGRWIVSLEKGVAIRNLRLPGHLGQLIAALERPRVRVEQIAVAFRCVLEFDGELGFYADGCEVRAQIDDVHAIAIRLDLGVCEDLQVSDGEGRVLAGAELEVRAPKPRSGVVLGQVVLVQIEKLEIVGTWVETTNRGELERLSRVR